MNKGKLSLSARSFVISLCIIIALMVFSYVLTFIVPAGNYLRITTEAGNEIIYTDVDHPYGIYSEVTRDFPFWKFLLSPFLVLGSKGNITLIAIVIFIFVIGGVFAVLAKQNIIEYFLKKMVFKYYKKRYVLLIILPFIFMLLSSFAGSFEEYIPLVPIMVSLAIALGWNNMIGLTFSIFAGGCGFAAGILNPFSTGIAQQVAGVSAFSGIWLRIVSFVILYAILVTFLFIVCKHYEKKHPFIPDEESVKLTANKKYDHAVLSFLLIVGLGVLIIICSTFISFLQDYTLIVFALCFLVGGVTSCFISQMKTKEFFKTFLSGAISMFPTVLMILCASSIKYILTESYTIDTLIKYLINSSMNLSPYVLILFIYLAVLIMEFFIPSGSAKAFLLIPLLAPVASMMNISINLVILAYIFGDGLANVLYPTNPGLIISLNLAETNYGKYFKYIWKIAVILLVVTCAILMFGLAVNYE